MSALTVYQLMKAFIYNHSGDVNHKVITRVMLMSPIQLLKWLLSSGGEKKSYKNGET